MISLRSNRFGATPPRGLPWLCLRAAAAATTLTATLAIAATPAVASEPIDSFNVTTSTTQAGGHPDLETSFTLGNPGSPEGAKNVAFNAPEGVFGNANVLTQCTSLDFALDQCYPNSQAGLITIYANYNGNPNYLLGTAPIYYLVPQLDETARLAFVVPILDIPIAIPLGVRTASDYGLRFTVSGITESAPLAGADLTLWGFPADQIHNGQRFTKGSPGDPAGCPGLADASCSDGAEVTIPNQPLTDNPTTCSGQPLTATLDVQTYEDPANPSHAEASYPATTGCEKETFNPVLRASLTTTQTDAPSGLNLDIGASQFEGFAASPSEVRSVSVALPPGLTINPDAADGQSACADQQANFGTEAPAACPDNSKIGTFAIGSPALSGSLQGSIYFGQPKPGDQYRLFLIADGFGIHAKLIGSIKPDPQTGQVTAFFNDLPQVPFSDFDIHLFASDRGLMATPTRCTLYAVDSDFSPWNASLADQHSFDQFGLDSGPNGTQCPGQVRPFHPRLVAGTSNPTAGAFSSFTLRLDRDDGDQFLGDLNFTMPPGFTGSLRGISYCPEASIAHAAQNPGLTEQAIPSCPASSQIGTTNVAAGPGNHPFHAVGKIYLAGPFKGAPLSLVAITPALAGPYDYGTVVVRVAVHVDSLDAHVIAVSDTVPSIIGGVPIRMRSIQVNLDKPNFIINPTNCSPFSIASQGIGDQGTVADFSSYFHAVNCAALGFAPKMTMRQLSGGTHRSADPSLRIDLTTGPGDANIKSLAVTLSNAFQIDQRHLGNICSEAELTSKQCAGRQVIGTAKTTTPLLDQPLSGPVYAVSGSGGLPRLAFILGGQVTLIPRADAKTIKGSRLRTTVPVVPDAPIGHFSFTLFGGKAGYLANTRNLCAQPPVSSVSYTAQNGKTLSQKLPLKASCGKARKSTGLPPRGAGHNRAAP
jgi:hypothetical protein